jgi:hypothetical protein
MSFGRALTMMALRTKDQWVRDTYLASRNALPGAFVDRASRGYSILLTGLEYTRAVAASLNLDLDDEIEEQKAVMLEYLESSAEMLDQSKRRTEVDLVMGEIGLMVQSCLQDIAVVPIIRGKHFLVLPQKDELILDFKAVFMLYKRHARLQGDRTVFNTFEQFDPLLKSEPYYLSDARVQREMGSTRKLYVLKLSAMQQKGIDTSLFTG